MFRIALVIAFWVVLVAGAGPVYKWVDEDGNVHYSDQPPPQGHEAEELILESAPSGDDVREAQKRLDALQAKYQTSQDQRSAAREEKRLQRELEEVQRVDRQRRCIFARQNLHTLKEKLPVYSIDEKGDRVYLDAEGRTAAIERKRAEINTFCD